MEYLRKPGCASMNNTHKKRLFILGAGFSKPAGLPLGKELLKEIKIYSDALPGEEYRRSFCLRKISDNSRNLFKVNHNISGINMLHQHFHQATKSLITALKVLSCAL